jgi:predicted ATPase/DNA-binding XRE family transcriptional regulator
MQEELSFGIWLRKQRRSLDLTRRAFAKQVGCAEVTLRHIEAGILKPSTELAGILLEKLGVPETERPRWVSFARGLSGFPLSSIPTSNTPRSNLPALLTTFIGREKEQSEIAQLVSKHRLVTLTGAGGVGKTRLAIKVGEQILENYAGSVWLVELAPILDSLLVPRTTAIAIGLRDEPKQPMIDMLSDYLLGKQMLIILDNCEHLLDACAQLADTLLKRCRELKILATSREPLGILGEAIYHVPSLELPDMQKLLENFRDYESVRLFEERAQLTRMDFSLTIENALSVAKICSRLDGIPLAIELAAARINTFSTEQVATRLEKSFRLLTTGNRTALPRHQTLQAAIDWSYDLLSPAEQTLFRRLSVFVNSWTLEAAEFVCSYAKIKSEMTLDLLTKLINKSLIITKEEHGKSRYRMLETIRQYANERLIEARESDVLRDRHLEYFLNLAEIAEPHLTRPEQLEWLPLLDADYENLRVAFEWSLNKETAAPALNLCKALAPFWMIRGYWREGLTRVNRALTKPSQREISNEKTARAKVLCIHAEFEGQLGNFVDMLTSAEESLALALQVSDKQGIALARYLVGMGLMFLGEDNDKALSLMEQSFTEFQALDQLILQASYYPYLGYFLARQGKLRVEHVASKCLELARQAGERLILAIALSNYADWLWRIDHEQEARVHAQESDQLYKQIGSENISTNSFLFAEIAWSKRNHEEARSLYMEMQERFSILGEMYWKSLCVENLGLLAMEEGNLPQAHVYLQQAAGLHQEVGYKPDIAHCLTELGNLSYLQGNIGESKKKFRESLSLRESFAPSHKSFILMTMVGSLCFEKPEISARILGVIHKFEKDSGYFRTPIEKRYWRRAKTHVRKTLSNAVFESAFAEGQKISLDEALDLALKTVEGI